MAQQTRTISGPRTKCDDFYKPVDCLDFQHELLILDGSHDSEMLPILFFVLLSFSPIHFFHLMVLARYLLLIDRYLDSLIDPLTRPFASGVLISDVGFLSISTKQMMVMLQNPILFEGYSVNISRCRRRYRNFDHL